MFTLNPQTNRYEYDGDLDTNIIKKFVELYSQYTKNYKEFCVFHRQDKMSRRQPKRHNRQAVQAPPLRQTRGSEFLSNHHRKAPLSL